MKKTIIFGLVLLLSITLVNAVCTVTLDKAVYSLGETATVTMSCSEQGEKNTAYTLNWTNSSGYVVQSNTGTTPAVAGTNFFQSFQINTSYVTDYGSELNASLYGTGLEGSDNATVQSAQTQDLIISNVQFTTIVLVGKRIGVSFDVKDENQKKITNAFCEVHIFDNDDNPIESSNTPFRSMDGTAAYTQSISKDNFDEETAYKSQVHCACGINGTDNACVDEDGLIVTNSIGTITGSFNTNKWLKVNTVTDKSIYNMKDEIYICANVTNVNSTARVPMHIYHQVRCSKDSDNDGDLDRVLVVSDGEQPDERGIGVGQTQMQCKRFIIPEPIYLQGRNSECYASTTTWVLNQNREKIVGYATTSSVFNITSSELNLNPDWQRQSKYIFNAIINLSAEDYLKYNGSGTGQVDIKIDSVGTYLRSYEQDEYSDYSLDTFYSTRYIKNVTAYNSSDEIGDYGLEFLDDGSIEIELRDVDISQSGWYNVTLEFENFDERQTEALEGIENKTGTFAFSISIPDQAQSPGTIAVSTSAQVELGGGPIEGHFICYIDGYQDETEVRWTHAVGTGSAYVDTKTITVPSGLTGAQSVVCKAGQASFTNLIHTASDVFTAITEPGAGAGGGEGSAGETEKRVSETRKLTEFLEPTFANLIYLVVGVAFLIIMTNRRDKDEKDEQ